MEFKRLKKMAATSFILTALLMVGATAHADGNSPGESFYAGAFVGHGTGIISAKSTILNTEGPGETVTPTTFETERGGLGLSGIQGGGWFGWGMKTADDLYFGLEGSFAGSDEKIELKAGSSVSADNQTAITSATAHRNWVGGGAVRVGYYVNNDTLFALKGGVAVSQFDVKIGDSSETYYAGGPQVGGSLTTKLSKLDPNLSLRMEFVYTNYLTAETNGQCGAGLNSVGTCSANNDSELTGHDTAGRIGVTYRFDVPSLF